MASENNLKRIRQSEGITRAQLARTSGITDKTIRNIENRKIAGKIETKSRLVNGLNTAAGKDYGYQEIFPHG